MHDSKLDLALQEAAARTFFALNGTGYARCDFRMTANGEIFLLEINPNCAVFYPEEAYGSADDILAMIPDGHTTFILHLLTLAQRRREERQLCWTLRFDRKNGFGIFAATPIKAGSLVKCYEECTQTIVTQRHVHQHWPSLSRRWFSQYAWPLNEDVYAIWSNNPEDWCPINHSCDPTVWLDGLNIVARRDIGPGEQLTLDYATFCGLTMTAFDCECGAAI